MLEPFAALPAAWHIATAAVFGLLVGSFLNVVIYRYPNRLKHAWSAQAHEWINEEAYPEEAPPGLIRPPSHCGNCKAPVKAWQNIPVISFLVLGGKCASCKTSISWRYPLVEILTAVMSALVVHRYGFSTASLFGVLLTWILITLSFIDFDHQLLPDDIVIPVLWLGLWLSLFGVYTEPTSAISGAIAGYLSFWLVFQLFKLVTGKEGMGHGDFKLLALLGAWLGWQYLPLIIFGSTIIGSVVGVALIASKKSGPGTAIPFGPYIALAGWVALLYGAQINAAYLNFSGL